MRPFTLAQNRADALLNMGNALLFGYRDRIIGLAARYKVPAMYDVRDYVTAGGLMSYGASITDAYRQAGVYVGRILNGTKPSDLPVIVPTKYEFVINLKTAKTLGLDIPDRLLALTDEVMNDPARVHHPAWRPGGRVAARGARAAGRADAAKSASFSSVA
jgi:putative tryptophan/tyrosine transport system substrate-binding protein